MKKNWKTIILTGYRATGKSCVGNLLAKRLGYSFFDTDNLIEERLGATIAEIVVQQGWPAFRALEQDILCELSTLDQVVISTGGGAIEHGAVWQTLYETCCVVWLEASAEIIEKRICQDPKSIQQRPSFAGLSLRQEIAAMLAKRMPLYKAGSHIHLDSGGSSPDCLVDKICAVFSSKQGSEEIIVEKEKL